MEAPRFDACVRHSASLPSFSRAVSAVAVEGGLEAAPTHLQRSSSDTYCEAKGVGKERGRGFSTCVNKCRNCGFGFFANYSKAGSEFCSLDCRTSCEWLKLIKEQKQSARQVTNQFAHIPAPFAGAAPAPPVRCADEPSQPIQMNAAPQTAAIPIVMA